MDRKFASVIIMILIAISLILEPVTAEKPLWIAAGGSPVEISNNGDYVLCDGEIFYLYNSKGEKQWGGYGSGYDFPAPSKITKDGNYFILGTDSGIVYLDRSMKLYWKDSDFHPIQDIALSPDENYIATVAESEVSLYTPEGQLLWRKYNPGSKSVAVSSNGLMTVASGGRGTIAYNQSGFQLWTSAGSGDNLVITIPDSNIITTSQYTLYFLHPSGLYLWKSLTSNIIRDFSSTPDGSYIVVGNEAGNIYLFNKSGNVLWKYNAGDWINSVSISPDGSIIAAGGNNKKLYVFNRDGRLLWDYATEGLVKSVVISADGSSLVAGSDRIYYFSLQPIQSSSLATPEITPTRTQAVETITLPSTTGPMETPTQKSGLRFSVLIALGISFVWIILRREK